MDRSLGEGSVVMRDGRSSPQTSEDDGSFACRLASDLVILSIRLWTTLPSMLQSFMFDYYFNKSLDNLALPSMLHSLTVGLVLL